MQSVVGSGIMPPCCGMLRLTLLVLRIWKPRHSLLDDPAMETVLPEDVRKDIEIFSMIMEQPIKEQNR